MYKLHSFDKKLSSKIGLQLLNRSLYVFKTNLMLRKSYEGESVNASQMAITSKGIEILI
jgi:hypothetical protein